MTKKHSPLTDRIRAALTAERETASTIREKSMFGGLSFMVDEKMVVAVQRDGLLLRVDPERSAELLTRPGATPAEMGAGRSMGPSWICVAQEALAADADLAFWVGVAMEYNARIRAGAR